MTGASAAGLDQTLIETCTATVASLYKNIEIPTSVKSLVDEILTEEKVTNMADLTIEDFSHYKLPTECEATTEPLIDAFSRCDDAYPEEVAEVYDKLLKMYPLHLNALYACHAVEKSVRENLCYSIVSNKYNQIEIPTALKSFVDHIFEREQVDDMLDLTLTDLKQYNAPEECASISRKLTDAFVDCGQASPATVEAVNDRLAGSHKLHSDVMYACRGARKLS